MTNQTMIHTIADVQKDVNNVLDEHYAHQISRAQQIDTNYADVWKAAHAQHLAGGKRLRPFLCITAYEACGGTDYKTVLPVAAALELLHAAMLIHDDIIDRDYVRRGQPNVAGLYQEKYAVTNHPDAEHFANSAALLAGDMLLSDAYQLVLTSNISDAQKVAVSKVLGDAVYNVVGGELLDSEASLYPLQDADSLKIAEYKTAFYSFAAPVIIGTLLANAPQTTQDNMQNFGSKLGIAFQLADDLLGVYGDQSKTGKTTLGDIREGKRTYLLQQTILRATPEQQVTVMTAVGNPDCTEAMALDVQEIMDSTGAKAATQQLIKQYADAAQGLLQKLNISDEHKQQLSEFILQMVHRQT